MFKINNKTLKLLCFYLLTLNIFHTFFNVSVVDFEQVNISKFFGKAILIALAMTIQLTFTCSKSTMETPEQCVKSVQS